MESSSRGLKILFNLFLVGSIAGLAGGLVFVYRELSDVRGRLNQPSATEVKEEVSQDVLSKEDSCGDECKKIVSEIVSETVASISAQPKEKVVYKEALSQQKSRTYLSLDGSFTTTNTDWTDITSTDVWINAEGEYGKDAYIDWEAFIKASGGSEVFVRLYDTNNKIGVNFSELKSNSTSSARLASGRLYLWNGHNLYRVQIKSLNGLPATFDGGRIKVVY